MTFQLKRILLEQISLVYFFYIKNGEIVLEKILDMGNIPEALPLLAKWHHDQWGFLNPGKTLEKRMKNMQDHLAGEKIPKTFVAVKDEEILGSAAIVVSDMDDRPDLTPWLASVFVDKDKRRQGTGAKLVNKVVKYAEGIGVETLYLFTPDKEKFYTSLGWETIEERVYHDCNVTIMKIHPAKV